ncbi:DUF1801 domain-containing protein [Herbiconiux liukaitaii]|uniref:DUF1801 domain-containing protein n=1 Tax=Herbiconiux liukaitaii TaxID=3342799 RepID=UPI0035B962F2
MQTVDDYLAELEHPKKAEIQELRALILAADPRIREGIKWNAPSFAVADWFATFTLRPPTQVRVVLHTGARAVPGHPDVVVDDPHGLLAWQGKDRAIATFADLSDIDVKREAFIRIVQQWVPQLPQG